MSCLLVLLPQSLFGQLENRENEVLETWLAERKLDDLLQEQLETRLESTIDGATRERIAQRLATLYRKKLLSSDGNPEQLLDRTRELVAIYPRFETGRLRVAMLHASYLRIEEEFREWIRQGARIDLQMTLIESIEEVHDRLDATIVGLDRETEDLLIAERLRQDPGLVDDRRKEAELELLHCQFLSGWTNYFLGVLDEKRQASLLKKSTNRFRNFLQLDQKTPLSDFDARWFDFSSAWHIRAMAGLAACSIATDRNSDADHLYDLIETNADTRESRESAIRFRVLAYCYSGRFELALKALDSHRTSDSGMSRDGTIRLYVATGEVARMHRVPDQVSRALKKAVLIGLTRDMAAELIVGQFADFQDQLSGTSGGPKESFHSCWIGGYVQFWKSENGEPAAASRAASQLQKALQLAQRTDESLRPGADDIARVQYLLGWLKLKKGHLSDAIGLFSMASDALLDVDPSLASEASWLAAKASARLGNRNPSRTNEAWSRLERFVRKWPDSPHSQEAGFEKLKIELRSMSPADAINRLKKIPKENVNWPNVLVEIVNQRYRLWQSRKMRTDDFESLKRASDSVLENELTSHRQRLRARFILLDALLRGESVDVEFSRRILDQCEQFVSDSESETQATIELHYYQMQLARRQEQVDLALSYARAIAGSGISSRFELPALILIAQQHDQTMLQSDLTQQETQLVLSDYRRLSELLGNDLDQLKTSANARVAFARLGEIELALGNAATGERIFRTLVDGFPANGKYLRNLAACLSANGKVAESKNLWRRLATESDAGSEIWFESKLELAKTISTSDPKAALALLKQTIQLGGDVPSSWRDKYETLINELERRGS